MADEKIIENKCVVSINVPSAIWTRDTKIGEKTKFSGTKIENLPVTGGCPGIAGSNKAIWAVLIQRCSAGDAFSSQFELYSKAVALLGKFPGADIAARCFSTGANSK